MSNVIKEYQEALNTTPPLKVDIAPAFTPPAGVQDPAPVPTPTIPASAFPTAPTQATPLPEQPQIQPPSTLLETPPTPTGETALAAGETVSRLSAQSAQDIQKILSESTTPKPNEVQKQLLGNGNPVQIDPRLTSQNNPFASKSEPRNAAERLAFEPPVLPNGMRNAFSNPNARAALSAGISKGEYIDYIQSLRDKGAQYVGFGERNVSAGGFTNTDGQRVIETEDFTGLSADQIRQKMKDRTGFYSTQRAFNQSFLPFLGEDRGSLETLFGVLSFPANLVKGVASDTVLRPLAAGISSGFDVEEFKKAYEALRPTRGGTFTGAAILGEQFSSLAVTQEKGKPFNPFAVVRDDSSIPQALVGLGLDVLLDPLNLPIGKAFSRFRRSAVVPPSITPEVLSPIRELPPSNVKGVLPEARTIDVPSVIDSPITPRTPTPERVLITPNREGRLYLPDNTTVTDRTSFQVTERPISETPQLGGVSDATVAQDRTSFQVTEKTAQPQIAASYEALVKYEPAQIEFPIPREPYVGGAIVKVEPADVQLYNNVTALFNNSPELPIAQNLLRAVVEQTPVPQIPYQNRILQEIADYGRTGELTPNIAVLKGATPDEVRAVVQDKLEVLRETPFVVPRLEVQPIEVPRLEFDITRQLPRKTQTTAAINPAVLNKDGSGITPNPSFLLELSGVSDNTGLVQSSARVDALARSIIASGETQPVIVRQINAVKFEVVGDNLTYLAAKRAEELDPKNAYEVRAVFVKPDSELEKLYLSQQRALEEVKKLSSDAVIESTSTGKSAFKIFNKAEDSRPYSVDLESITTSRGGAYNKEAVETLARSFLESGQNIRPIVVRRTGTETFEVIRGNLEYLAAKRASEIDPRFEAVNSYIVDAGNEAALLAQLDILDDVLPVPTNKPVVVTESAITSVSQLQDAAKGIGTLGEVSQWSVRVDFNTPIKEVLDAVDDLGIDVLNTPALSRMVKGGIGKLSNKTVEGVASSLQKVSIETAEDIAKSIFNALWRKSTPDQKEIILGKVSATRIEQLGLERVQTEITPPTTPAPLQYVQAGVLDDVTVAAYQVVNDSQIPIEKLHVAILREQGFDGRTASSMKVHSISEEIALTGKVSDESLAQLIKNRELSVSTPSEQKWSSKMLQQIWEVATPEQKAYIMKNVDNLEQLGLERIVRSNVIDDHLPPEGVFDTPC
jgi:hypothetical protein